MPVKRKRAAAAASASVVAATTTVAAATANGGDTKSKRPRKSAAAPVAASTDPVAAAAAAAAAAVAADSTTAPLFDRTKSSAAKLATQQSLIGDRPKKVFEILTAALVKCSYDVISIITSYDREGVILFVDESGDFTVWSVDQNEFIVKKLYIRPSALQAERKALHRDQPSVPATPFSLVWCSGDGGGGGGGRGDGVLAFRATDPVDPVDPNTLECPLAILHADSPLNYDLLSAVRRMPMHWHYDPRAPLVACRLPRQRILTANVMMKKRSSQRRSDFLVWDYTRDGDTCSDPIVLQSSKPRSIQWSSHLLQRLCDVETTATGIHDSLRADFQTLMAMPPASRAMLQARINSALSTLTLASSETLPLIGRLYLDTASEELQHASAGIVSVLDVNGLPAGSNCKPTTVHGAEFMRVLGDVQRQRKRDGVPPVQPVAASTGRSKSLLQPAANLPLSHFEWTLSPVRLLRQYFVRVTALLPFPPPYEHVVLWLAHWNGQTEVGAFDTDFQTEWMAPAPVDSDDDDSDAEAQGSDTDADEEATRPRRVVIPQVVTHAQWCIVPSAAATAGAGSSGYHLSLIAVCENGTIYSFAPSMPVPLSDAPFATREMPDSQLDAFGRWCEHAQSQPLATADGAAAAAAAAATAGVSPSSAVAVSIPGDSAAIRTVVMSSDGSGRVLCAGENDASLSLITPRCNALGRVTELTIETLRRTCSLRERKFSVERIAILDRNRIAVASASRIRIWDVSTREGEQQTCANVELTRSSTKRNTRIVHLLALS